MKKILASLLAITMVISTMSACIIPAAAENPVLTEGFKEDFENYGTGNWLANMTADSDLVDSTKIDNMGASDWTVYGGYYASEQYTPEKLIEKGVSVGVVADPDNADNQVLKIDVGDFEEKEWIRVRRNSNDGSAIKRADLPKGKKMVIKAKFKLPTEFTGSANTALFTYDRQSKQIKKWMNENMSGNYNGKKWTVLATDAISYGSNLQSGAETTVKTGEWFDLKYIVDITDHKTEDHPADTYRAFYDGSIYTHYLPDVSKVTSKIRDLNKKFPQPSETAGVLGGKIVESFGGYINPPEGTTYRDFGSFYGASMTVAGSGKAGDYMYMDDIEVYYIDPFKQEGDVTFEKTNNGIWYAGKITIPFNNDLMTVVKENGEELDYASLFTLKNEAGEVVEGGIANAYAEGKNLIIEPAKAIERNASYTISASPLFMDAEGQGLNQFSKEQDILTFETAEDPYAHIYFDENFDDYTDLTSNWTENLDSNGFVTLEGVEAKAWKIGTNAGASNITKGIVKVAKDPLDSGRGNVLEINSGTHDAKKTVNILRTPNGENPISHASMTGKRIVIEADIYMPTAIDVQEETLLAYYGQGAMNKSRPNDAITPYTSQTSKGRAYLLGSGNYGDTDSLRIQHNGQNAWHTYRYVIDVSGEVSATRIDTHRGYLDGNLVVGTAWERGSNDVGAMPEYPQYEADGTDRKVVDFWKRTAGAFGSSLTSVAKSAGDFYGVYMSIRQDDSKNQAYYVDNIKAYYVEDLELTRPNLSDYTGGTITLAFNQEIPETFNVNVDGKSVTQYTLSDMITLADKDGNEIEDGLNLKLSADKKNVIVSPKKIESNNDYKIVISRYFRDAEGQGLTKNSTETILDMHVGDFVPFAFKGLSQDSVSGFITGRDVKVTAEFTLPIDDTMVKEGIVVKNSKGEEIPYGKWTYEYEKDDAGLVNNKKSCLTSQILTQMII